MIRLINGRMIDPLNLQPADMDPHAVIHALSLLNRYGGHTKLPYSVAEHVVHLVEKVPAHLKLVAFFHEFPEGLGFVDLVSPVKRRMPEYKMYEDAALGCVLNHFGVPAWCLDEFHEFDQRICQDEMQQVFFEPYDAGLEPLGVTVQFWSPEVARARLRKVARELGVLG